jgi:hypothetical protein
VAKSEADLVKPHCEPVGERQLVVLVLVVAQRARQKCGRS